MVFIGVKYFFSLGSAADKLSRHYFFSTKTSIFKSQSTNRMFFSAHFRDRIFFSSKFADKNCFPPKNIAPPPSS